MICTDVLMPLGFFTLRATPGVDTHLVPTFSDAVSAPIATPNGLLFGNVRHRTAYVSCKYMPLYILPTTWVHVDLSEYPALISKQNLRINYCLGYIYINTTH